VHQRTRISRSSLRSLAPRNTIILLKCAFLMDSLASSARVVQCTLPEYTRARLRRAYHRRGHGDAMIRGAAVWLYVPAGPRAQLETRPEDPRNRRIHEPTRNKRVYAADNTIHLGITGLLTGIFLSSPKGLSHEVYRVEIHRILRREGEAQHLRTRISRRSRQVPCDTRRCTYNRGVSVNETYRFG